MLHVFRTCALALLVTAALAAPARAVLTDFTGSITLTLGGQGPLEIATLSGQIDVLPDGRLVVPPQIFSTVAGVNFPVLSPTDDFLSSFRVTPTAFGGGTLFSTGLQGGFYGSAPVSGSLGFLVKPGPFADGTVSLGLGYLTTVATPETPATGSTYLTFTAFFSLWTMYLPTGSSVYGTIDGSTTVYYTPVGSRSTTPGGNTILSLVSPVQIAQVGSTGTLQTRFYPGVGRMTLTVMPEPTRLLLQGIAFLTALVLGFQRLRA